MISGKIKKKPPQGRRKEKMILKSAGSQVVNNFVDNVKTVVDNSGEIIDGVKEKNSKKIIRGAKTLVKVVAIGAITVGAIKIKPEEKDENDQDRKNPIRMIKNRLNKIRPK